MGLSVELNTASWGNWVVTVGDICHVTGTSASPACGLGAAMCD